jgi:hypothetical protein
LSHSRHCTRGANSSDFGTPKSRIHHVLQAIGTRWGDKKTELWNVESSS